jgi:hypothetical protein
MPYCPKCRDEFEDWVKVCPDCKVALVEKLPPLPETDETDEPLVLIATAPGEPIAAMWSGILEEQGIKAMLKGGDLGAAMYASTLNLPFEIYVLESQADTARDILAPFIEE